MSDPEKIVADMSIEDLEKLMQNPDSLLTGVAAESEPAPEPKPEPAPETTPEPKPEKGDPAPEPTPEPQADPIEELRLHNQELELRIEEVSRAQSRSAGKSGYLEKNIKEIKELLQARRGEEANVQDDPEPSARTSNQSLPTRDAIASWAISQAIGAAANQFHQSHSDLAELIDPKLKEVALAEAQQRIQQEIMKHVGEMGVDPTLITEADDPIQAGRATADLLDEIYHRIKRVAVSRQRQDLSTRRADQMRSLADAKKRAVVSGGGSATPPKPKSKSLGDMSIQELDAQLREMTR